MTTDPFIENKETFINAMTHYKKGEEYMKAERYDMALSEFRKATTVDPMLFEAHYQIGLLCRSRGEEDSLYLRHAYDAFRKAAHLNHHHEPAHDCYITASQKMGRLDQTLSEYDQWLKLDPKNELLLRCRKNIITISMALIPEQVNMEGQGSSAFLRKTIFLCSLAGLAMGFALIFGAPMFKNSIRMLQNPATLRAFVKLGFFLSVTGLFGFVVRSRMK